MTKTETATTYAGGLNRKQVLAWRNSLFAIFALCGIAMSTWMSRVPSVRDSFEASTATMSILAFSIAAGSIAGLVLSSHIIARFGANRTIFIGLVSGAVGLVIASIGATAGLSFAITMIGLALFGAVFGICDVAMNVSGAAQERVLGKPIMPIFHAFFSFGTVGGALLSVVMARYAVPLAIHVAGIAVVMVIVAIIVVRALQSEHIIEDGAEPVADDDHSKTWRGRLSIWRDPRTLFIGLIVLGMAFAEGSANDWLSLAIVDGYGTTNATGALFLGIFVGAMSVGRLAGVAVLDRYGRVPVLRGSAVLAVIGLVVLIFPPMIFGQNLVVAGIGVALWGLGAALGFPVGMSAAADDPKTAAARVSAVATIGYFAFLVGPPLIGTLGEHFGLLNALLVVLVLVGIAGLASGAAREPIKAT